ncbi:unnamed protein product [Effrenium voratum]|uniref:Endonuclease/exonuclease/phosphatase domain-containing protein n=1 Tax=Effrenium voratum TaxID=2562239 RepID=A0AA36N238_9DINO|nr:unnamed protein product [Effrenium voratum]
MVSHMPSSVSRAMNARGPKQASHAFGRRQAANPLRRFPAISSGMACACVAASRRSVRSASSEPREVEVWSFNLRTEKAKEADAANSWAQRRDEVALFISKYSPAIVCAQEATGAMLSHLSDKLGGRYAWKGTSRKLEVEDECAGFLFDAEQVELESHGCFWLAPPGTPKGRPGWDAKLPRTCETAVFRMLSQPELKLRVLNTHFDHQGVQARQESAALLKDDILSFAASDPGCPQILCGDFNSAKSSVQYAILTEPSGETAMQDALRRVPPDGLDTAGVVSTIHKWQGVSFTEEKGDGTVDLSDDSAFDSRHIDWILWLDSSPHAVESTVLDPLSCRVLTDTLPSGRYPSDHFPLSATFAVNSLSNVPSRL